MTAQDLARFQRNQRRHEFRPTRKQIAHAMGVRWELEDRRRGRQPVQQSVSSKAFVVWIVIGLTLASLLLV